jgi:hypothetical protein
LHRAQLDLGWPAGVGHQTQRQVGETTLVARLVAAVGEMMDQREGAELLALGMFFGITSDPRFQQNQERLKMLSDEQY